MCEHSRLHTGMKYSAFFASISHSNILTTRITLEMQNTKTLREERVYEHVINDLAWQLIPF